MMPGLIVLTRAPRFAPPHRLGHNPQRIPALGELVSVEGVLHLVRLKHRESAAIRPRALSRGPRFAPRSARPSDARTGCDDDAGAAASDDVAELLEHERGAIEIDREDRRRRRLCGGDACGVDDASDFAERRGGLDERVERFARGHVDGRGAHLEAGIAQDLCRRLGVFLAQVSQQHMLAALTRRAIACPIDPAPMTTMTLFIVFISLNVLPMCRMAFSQDVNVSHRVVDPA